MRVIVSGGGIGGLALAAGLRVRGIDVVVLEQGPGVDATGAGLTLWPNALSALERLRPGLGEGVRASGATAVESQLRTAGGRVLSRVPAERAGAVLGGAPTCVHRTDLAGLLAGAAGPVVRYGASVVGADHEGAGVRVDLAGGDAVAGDVLVAADGVTSPLAAQLHAGTPVRYAGWTAWRAVVDVDPVEHARLPASESFGRGERFGIVPMAGSRVYWYATANRPEGERSARGEWLEVAERFAGWHDPIAQLVKATDPDAVLRHDVYDRRALPSWTDGRIALLRDAAHPMQPNLGQGACQALEDAAVLADELAGIAPAVPHPSHGAVVAALGRYEAARRPVADRVVAESRRLGRVGQASSRLAVTVRNLVLSTVPAGAVLRHASSFASATPPAPS